MATTTTSAAAPATKPGRSGLILTTLILGAIVANVNTSISNVALPDIGRALDATNTQLTGITDAYQLGIAATVLYLGAIGDRYGRKKLLVLGAVLVVPFSFLSAFASGSWELMAAQIAVGVAGGMLYPTTLSLISALYSGAARTRAIALWTGIGGGASVFGPLLGGWLLEQFWWGSVFLITVPLAVLVVVLAMACIPRRAGENDTPVDHRGGVASVVALSTFVLGIVLLPNGFSPVVIGLFVVALVAGAAFFVRQSRAAHPLFNLKVAAEPTFWVAFTAGIVAFGALVGALFLGQQFTQNVLGLSPFDAVLLTIPIGLTMIVSSPIAGRLLMRIGGRNTMLVGFGALAVGFAIMMVAWRPGASVAWVVAAYAIHGIGIGFGSTPATHALSASTPVRQAGMGSASADLMKDLGGAVFQALLGSVLAVVYGRYLGRAYAQLPEAQAQALGEENAEKIRLSIESAEDVARSFPQPTSGRIVDAAQQAFTEGKSVAIALALFTVVVASALVLWKFPRRDAEIAAYAAIDEQDAAAEAADEQNAAAEAAGGETT
jgi:DHA2 family multidrug resistance protein-like MFS transporter